MYGDGVAELRKLPALRILFEACRQKSE